MRRSLFSFFLILAGVLIVGFPCVISPALAASAIEIDAKANAALEDFFDKAPAGKELAEKAAGILIFPSVIKAGVVVGAEYGEGVLRIGGFTAGYYATTSGSVGIQLGMQSKNVFIMFMDASALKEFQDSKGWEVGVDGSVALVTLGAGGAIDTNTIKEPIIGFIAGQKGLMFNVSLEGTKLTKIVR
jgi:lipid-binding SYLF domain-containing protein